MGGVSRVIQNYSSWLPESTLTVSLGNSMPRLLRWFLISGPALVLNRFSKGLGSLWAYFLTNLSFRILLTRFNGSEKIVYMAHDIESFNATASRKSQKILVVHDYYTASLIVAGYIRSGSVFEHFFKAIEASAYRKADIVLTVDNRINQYVVGFGVPSGKVRTLLNALDTRAFQWCPRKKDQFRREFNLPYDRSVILIARRLVTKTGIEYAISAAEQVCRHNPKCLFAIVGVGPDEKKLRRMVETLDLTSNVVFMGGVEPTRMYKLYNAADIVLVPSVHINGIEEATSLSALEAMSCGKPVIASNIGGLKEIINDHENGFLIPEKNPSRLAKSIMSLIDNPESSYHIGLSAHEFAVKHEDHVKFQLLQIVDAITREDLAQTQG